MSFVLIYFVRCLSFIQQLLFLDFIKINASLAYFVWQIQISGYLRFCTQDLEYFLKTLRKISFSTGIFFSRRINSMFPIFLKLVVSTQTAINCVISSKVYMHYLYVHHEQTNFNHFMSENRQIILGSWWEAKVKCD